MIESRQVKSVSSSVRSFQGETHTHIKTRTLRQVKSKRSIRLPSRQVKPHTTTFVAEPTRAARSARRATLRTRSTEHRRALNAARRAIHNEMHPRSIHVIHARAPASGRASQPGLPRSAIMNKMGLATEKVQSSKGGNYAFPLRLPTYRSAYAATSRAAAPDATRRDGARLSAHTEERTSQTNICHLAHTLDVAHVSSSSSSNVEASS